MTIIVFENNYLNMHLIPIFTKFSAQNIINKLINYLSRIYTVGKLLILLDTNCTRSSKTAPPASPPQKTHEPLPPLPPLRSQKSSEKSKAGTAAGLAGAFRT